MLIHPRPDTHNSNPQLIILDKDNPLPMQATDNNPTTLHLHKVDSLPNLPNTIHPKILANSLNGDEEKKCDDFCVFLDEI